MRRTVRSMATLWPDQAAPHKAVMELGTRVRDEQPDYVQLPPCSEQRRPVLLHCAQVDSLNVSEFGPPLHASQSLKVRAHFLHCMSRTSTDQSSQPI